MPDVPRYYWDSCVFLSAVSPNPTNPNRAPAVEHLLAEAEAGRVKIFTSTITIAEVAFDIEEKANKLLDATKEEDINALWAPGGPVIFVEYGRLIGLNARALIRAGLPDGRSLKPFDAVHLASAIYAEVDEIHSYNGALTRYSTAAAKVNISMQEPPQPPLTLDLGTVGSSSA